MKILFYINVLSHGGAERVISNVATMMSKRGHQCVLATSYPLENEYRLGEDVVRYNLSQYPINNFILRNFSLTFKLRSLLKKEKPDILVSFMAEPNFRACFASFFMNVKTILSVRNDPNREYGGVLNSILAKSLFLVSDGIIFQTNDAINWFPKRIRRKGHIIINSVDESFYKVSVAHNCSGIVSTGRICQQKNHRLLIEAFAKIADRVSDDLTIYGEGDCSKLKIIAEERGVSERVHFPGLIDDVANTINHYKVYALSSDYEGMPNALLEAMAVGLPCISTDCPCGGPRMIFNGKMKEFLTPVGDSDALAEKLLILLSDKAIRDRHATNCKREADKFRPEVINDQWEKYFNGFKE